MLNYQRYAIFYLPDDTKLAAFGASWLGWDIATGTACDQPNVAEIEKLTEAPRKYGFHGTLKPPFHLKTGETLLELSRAVRKLAEETSVIWLDGIHLSKMGGFLALVPYGDTADLDRIAFKCVTELDAFRMPASQAELTKRKAAGLSARQDALLSQWGYPYVGEEFRFHLTLTGKLTATETDIVTDQIAKRMPELSGPFEVSSIALVGQQTDGGFKLIHRYALTG